jgi:hypothetical protein
MLYKRCSLSFDYTHATLIFFKCTATLLEERTCYVASYRFAMLELMQDGVTGHACLLAYCST